MITPLTTTLSPADSLIEATRRLLELRMEQLPVTDEEGRLVGLIARGGLLRALMQASR
jgi:CBS domain-containing protein